MKLAIVGLDMMSTSLGLALKAVAADTSIIGHDPDAKQVARAMKLRAIDSSHWNLISACAHADLIILSLPLNAVEETLVALRDDLEKQVVIMVLAPLQRPVFEWAKRALPEGAHFIGAHIVSSRLLGETQPSGDLLREAAFYIVTLEETASTSVSMVSDLATAVGAIPQYIDPAEHDGLVAATAQLPVAAAIVLFGMVAGSAGGTDRMRICEGEIYELGLVLNSASARADVLLHNSDNLLYWLDAYAVALDKLKQSVAEGDQRALDETLSRALESYRKCQDGNRAPSEEELSPVKPATEERGNWFRDMFLGRMGWRKPRR